jgi:lipid-A-disaccharide synthase
LFEAALWRCGAQELPFQILFGHAHDALAACDAALVASGTATLEAALFKAPHVIAYKISPWSWRVMRHMGYQPWVGLPNILAGRFIVPEFLQDDATPANLAQALGNLATDVQVRNRLASEFQRMHVELRQGTAERVASAVLPYVVAPA